MKDPALRQAAVAKKLTVSFAAADLPAPDARTRRRTLGSFGVAVNCAVALPGARVALAFGEDGEARVFALSDARHALVEVRLHATKITDMASLGGDIVASADCGGRVRVWDASSGALLGSVDLSSRRRMWTAVCALGVGSFAVGDSAGNMHFLEHEQGRRVRRVRCVRRAHRRYVSWLAHHDGTLVAASDDWSASVWDASAQRCVTRLPHSYRVFCVAVSATHIATACGKEVRLYRNGADYAMLSVYRGLHADFKCFSVALASADLLVTGGVDSLVSYTSIEMGAPLARCRTSVASMTNIELTDDGSIVACSEWGDQCAIVQPPLVAAIAASDSRTITSAKSTKRAANWRLIGAALLSTLAITLRLRSCSK